MFRYSMSLMDSYNFVIALRPQVRPNSYFRKQLEIYEHELAYSRFKSQFKNKAFQEISTRSVSNSQIKMWHHSWIIITIITIIIIKKASLMGIILYFQSYKELYKFVYFNSSLSTSYLIVFFSFSHSLYFNL